MVTALRPRVLVGPLGPHDPSVTMPPPHTNITAECRNHSRHAVSGRDQWTRNENGALCNRCPQTTGASQLLFLPEAYRAKYDSTPRLNFCAIAAEGAGLSGTGPFGFFLGQEAGDGLAMKARLGM